MITLTQKQKIILDHLNNISNRTIAATYGISKDTVNKYVNEYEEQRVALLAMNPDMEVSEIMQAFVEKPKYDTRNRGPKDSTLEAMDVIEDCLRMNEKKRMQGRSKQTMKKIDIHEYLIRQGFNISYSTVKRLTKAIEDRHKEAFLRQEYELGDNCEFDWGTVKLDIGGTGYRNYQMAVFVPSKSNYRFAKLYMSQDTAAFQESHADFFAHCRGSYHQMTYDNMKVAVKRFVGPTEKEPTTALTELSLYYGFSFRFCNIASGNEKGHVERSVEFVRRKVFSGPGNDVFDTLEDANNFLYRECMKLNAREISNATIPLEVFEEEKKYLLPPMPKFESCIKSTGKVDKYSTVMVMQNHYSVPDTMVGKTVDIRTYTDKIVIYENSEIIAKHARSFKCHDWTIDIYHYLRTLKRKPGALHQSTALLQMDTMVKNIYDNYYSNNPKTFLDVLELIYEKGVDDVYAAIQSLQVLSPLDMGADKLRIICDKADSSKNLKVGIDHLSIKSKSTLAQYDKLRQAQKERMVV